MIDWEEILKAESVEELKEAKLWLFRENMRVESEKRELANRQDKFEEECACFRKEFELLNHKTQNERKRMKEETLFFEKKLEILKDGFRQLDEDRRKLEREKSRFEQEKTKEKSKGFEKHFSGFAGSCSNIAEVLFRNVNNPLTLRKRYRDLMKIFHPDNLCGDEELVQQINKEFTHRKEQM